MLEAKMLMTYYMPIRVNESKLQLISPSTKPGFKNMLYKKSVFAYVGLFPARLVYIKYSFESSCSSSTHTQSAPLSRSMSTPTGQARQGCDSTDKLILKTNAWRIILNRKLTFRRRYLYNLYIKWSSSSFYCLMATISLSEPPLKIALLFTACTLSDF